MKKMKLVALGVLTLAGAVVGCGGNAAKPPNQGGGGNATQSGGNGGVVNNGGNGGSAPLGPRFDGTYALDNHFDLTGALPPSIGVPVKALAELTDDTDVSGANCGNATLDPLFHQCGKDPGAFLMDLVYRQICAWECLPGSVDGGNPTYDSCVPQNHGYGDLRDLYTKNFVTWPDAVSRLNVPSTAIGTCSVIPFVDTTAQNAINNFISNNSDNNVVKLVTGIAQIGSDLASVVTELHIKSSLSLTNLSSGQSSTFTHQLMTLEVTVHDLNGKAITKDVPLNDPTYPIVSAAATGTATSPSDGELSLPNHTFTLSFGKIIAYVYHNVLLNPAGTGVLPYKDTADILGHLIDCTSIGTTVHSTLLGGTDPISTALGGFLSAAQLTTYCQQGLTAGAGVIDNQIDGAIKTTATITMSGTATGDTLSSSKIYTDLTAGNWTASFTEGSTTKKFDGTFTGKLAP